MLSAIKNTVWVEYICDAFSYPEKAKEQLLECYKKITENNDAFTLFCNTYAEYCNDYKTNFEKMSEQIKQGSIIAGVHEYTAYSLYLIYMLNPLKQFYAENGYSVEMWKGVALDVKYKLLEGYDVHGIYGTFFMIWFDRFFDLTRFCFGRLQMETIPLDGDYTVDGVNLKKGDTVLSVHIPKTGERLDKESVENAYNQAKEFYKDVFKSEYTVFTCQTYLLHEVTLSFLKKDSNLYKFVSDYTIVYNRDYPDYTEMWRLYDCNVIGKDLADLPSDTSLRRKYIEYMRTGKKIGYGHGIYISR